MKASSLSAALAVVVCLASQAAAREWTDSTGKYVTGGDLVAFDKKLVVLKKKDKQLVALHLNELSKKDQEYLQSKEAAEANGSPANRYQTWTMRNGLKVVGRVVDYARKPVTIQRRRGKVYVNDRLFDNLPEIYRRMVPQIVAHFEKIDIPDKNAFDSWVLKQRDQARTFNCEGVMLELENGDEYGVPFFFFSNNDLAVLRPGWERWAAQEKYKEQQEHEAFLLESQAQAYQRDRQASQQIALMQLQMQGYEAGLFDLWEVGLMPGPGVNSPPLVVVVPGRDSRQAAQVAMSRNPGFIAGATVRVRRL